MKFTFIMPAYNAEKTIERAVRSIMDQTYKELQILIIDDGSQDSTLEIIKKLEQEDSRIEFYHKENGGVGSALIYAFGKVKGDYCLFVDSDDYIETFLAEKVKTEIDRTSADIVHFGLRRFTEDGRELPPTQFIERSVEGTETILKDYFYGLSSGTNFPGLSTRAVRSSLFNDFNYYSSSLSIDEVLAVHVLSRAQIVSFISDLCYCAILYQTSVSRSEVTSKKVVGQFEGLSLIPKLVANFDGEIRGLAAVKLLSFVANFYKYFVNGYGKTIARRKITELYGVYKSNRKIVKVSNKTKVTIWSIRYTPFLNMLKNKFSQV